jgi:hypothetical protein
MTMTKSMEVVARYAKAGRSPEIIVELQVSPDGVLHIGELESVQHLIGGFFFRTARTPQEILTAFTESGFEPSDFKEISFGDFKE